MLTITFVSIAIAAVFGFVTWRVWQEDRRRSAARVAALASAIEGPLVAEGSVATPLLFTSADGSAMRGHPLLKVAGGFAVAVAVIVLIAMTSERGPAVAPVTANEETAPALELVSMRHVRTGDSVTVTGLVRNPGILSRDRLIAVVLAFNRAGDFIGSGRAPLEFPVLASGDESPFQVTIPNVVDLGRYRISFRTESGVVRHVDRRATRASLGV